MLVAGTKSQFSEVTKLLNTTGSVIYAVMTEIENQLYAYGISQSDLRVMRGDQPTQQNAGATTGTEKHQVFLSPVTRKNYNIERVDTNDGTDITANYTHMNSITYQISCLSDFDPSSETDIEAHDLCEIISELLQQHDAISNLSAGGVFLQLCSDVRPSFTVLDHGVYESTPSFDLTVNYNSTYAKVVPSTDVVTGSIQGV